MVVGDIEVGTDILVVGAGPAGYTCAIAAARQGLDVTLVNRNELGGMCLHKGCIPVKTLLHVYRLASEVKASAAMGVKADNVSVDHDKAYAWKNTVIKRLETGIRELCEGSGVQMMEGACTFASSSRAIVNGPSGTQHVLFKRAVIAAGGHHRPLPGIPFDGTLIVNPDEALDLAGDNIVILGGGYAAVTFAALLASQNKTFTIIHKGERLISFLDEELQRPVIKRFEEAGITIYSASSWNVKRSEDRVRIDFDGGGKKQTIEAKKLICDNGIVGNVEGLGLETTGVKVGKDGFIIAGDNYRTDDPAIYAIGDVCGMRGNASTAYRQGQAMADILAGKPGLPDYIVTPLTISTDPEISSAGLSETKARAAGIDLLVGRFPFTANGKAVSLGKTAGFVKVVAEKSSHRILGIHSVGEDAFNISQEGALAIEMGARLEDVILTLHPHPTLCEAVREACADALRASTNIMEKK